MRRLAAAALCAAFILTLLAPTVTQAAVPPPNDMFASATFIPSFPFPADGTSSATVDVGSATTQDGEPLTYCGGSSAVAATRSVWYRYQAPATGAVAVFVDPSSTGDYRLTTYDTTATGAWNNLRLVTCRAAGSPSTARVVAGRTYYLQITDSVGGGGSVSFHLVFYPPPTNNDFAGAKPVGALPWSDTVPLYAATIESGEPNLCGIATSVWPDRRTVWYSFDARADGDMLVETSEDNGAVARIVPLADGGTGWNGTTPGACSDGTFTTFTVEAGRRYFVQVVNFSGQGTLSIRFTFSGIPGPANDDLGSAEPIDAFPFSATPVDTSHATSQTGELTYCGSSSRTVWYTFVAPSNGTATASTIGSSFSDGAVAVYRATGTAFADLAYLTCGAGGGSVTFGLDAGVTYYLQAADGGSGGGTLALSVTTAEAPTPPSNDAFADALAIDHVPFSDHGRITTGANSEAGEPHGCGGSSRTVWYRFAADSDGGFVATIAPTSFWDHALAIYEDGGAGLEALAQGGCTTGSSLTAPVLAGHTYYVQVSDTFSGGGMLDIDFAFAPSPENDDFAGAAPIGSYPASVSIDLTAATAEQGEPSPCAWDPAPRTVWYALDPSTDGIVSVVPAGFGPALAAYAAAAPGFPGLTLLASTTWSSVQFRAYAGTRYYVQASACGSTTAFFALTVSVTPPAPNDDIATATVITGFPASESVATGGATLEPGESTPCVYMDSRTVWYAVTPGSDGALTVDTGRSTAWYLVVNVYTSAGPASNYGDLTLLVCGNYGRTPVPVRAGTTYYVQIADYGSPGGVLNVAFDLATRPPNDDFANAVAVSGATYTDTVDTRAATREAGEPASITSRTVWYRVDARVTGAASVDPAGSSPGDVLMTLYQTNGPSFAGLQYVKAAWGTPLTWTALAGSRYYVQVNDWGSGGGSFHLGFSLPTDSTPPRVSIDGAASSYPVDGAISITATAIDALDPAPAVTCTLTGPGATPAPVSCAYAADAWSLGAGGTYVFAVTATDGSGNSASASATFDVVATYASVSNLTKAWSSKATVAKDLVAILDSAYAAEQRGQYTAESKKLAEYRAGVKAQSGKAFTAEKAGLLIAFTDGL